DVVTAQQTLATYIAAYLTALQEEWTAITDVANLLQTDDLFQAAPAHDHQPLGDFEFLLPPPEGKHHAAGGPGAPCAPAVPAAPEQPLPVPPMERAQPAAPRLRPPQRPPAATASPGAAPRP